MRILKILGAVLAVLALLLVARFIHMSATSEPPDDLGLASGRLAPCPEKPNCVSSQAPDGEQQVEPLELGDAPDEAMTRVLEAISKMPRARVVDHGDGYLHAEFTSLIFRFVDDLELAYDASVPGFHVRSASRSGHSDLGVNRKRVETLRRLLSE